MIDGGTGRPPATGQVGSAAGVLAPRGGRPASSGGQRQQAWIAMALAQGTDQLQARDRTVVMVLHDLTLATRYAGHPVALRDGAVVA
jgi:ABC-type cobalamin/Fe3+-siderophores transport system ATPase subunit